MKVRLKKKCKNSECIDCILGLCGVGRGIVVGSVVEVKRFVKDGDMLSDEEGQVSKLFGMSFENPANVSSWCSRDFKVDARRKSFGWSTLGYGISNGCSQLRYIPHESGFFEPARTWKKL